MLIKTFFYFHFYEFAVRAQRYSQMLGRENLSCADAGIEFSQMTAELKQAKEQWEQERRFLSLDFLNGKQQVAILHQCFRVQKQGDKPADLFLSRIACSMMKIGQELETTQINGRSDNLKRSPVPSLRPYAEAVKRETFAELVVKNLGCDSKEELDSELAQLHSTRSSLSKNDLARLAAECRIYAEQLSCGESYSRNLHPLFHGLLAIAGGIGSEWISRIIDRFEYLRSLVKSNATSPAAAAKQLALVASRVADGIPKRGNLLGAVGLGANALRQSFSNPGAIPEYIDRFIDPRDDEQLDAALDKSNVPKNYEAAQRLEQSFKRG